HQPQGDHWLEQIQAQLFNLGADLATPLDAKSNWVIRMDSAKVAWLETCIDEMTAELPELTTFILPGGTPAAAHLHVARTVCRRAERLVVALAQHDPVGDQIVPYLNRLSDLLFTLARWENMKAGIAETGWTNS